MDIVSSADLADPIEKLVEVYVRSLTEAKPAGTPIHVDEIASRIAKLYELIRKVVDWKDDNLLRRNAIQRILKRLLFSRLSGLTFTGHIEAHKLAETITLDLIRGGHLPNDEIPQEKIEDISRILDKYIYLFEHAEISDSDPLAVKERINYFTFLIELAACEIEEILADQVLADTLILSMTHTMLSRIHIRPNDALSEDEKYVQTFIAVCRALFDLDDAFINYHLLVFQYPEWRSSSSEFIRQMNQTLPGIWKQLPAILQHPLTKQFYAYCERYDTVFALIGDVLAAHTEDPHNIPNLFVQRDELLKEIEIHYDKRYATLKKRLFMFGVFSTLSVFASNWVTFFLVEVPLANMFAEGFNLFTAFIDFLIPTAIMFGLVAVIRPPKPINKKQVLEAVEQFMYKGEKIRYYEVKAGPHRRPVVTFVLAIFSFMLTVGILGGIGWVFWIAGLPITSVFFDTFTIALTVFAAVTIRNKSKELTVGDRSSITEFLLDMLSVPVAKLGSFLASKWKEYNIIAFVFTFLIETPFVVVVDLIEQWSQFLKDRRSELR